MVFRGRQEKGLIWDVKKLWAEYKGKSKKGEVIRHDGFRDRAELPSFRRHHFRHNFIGWGKSVGLDEWMVAGLVGHATKWIITRQCAGLQVHPARRASQLIADAMVAAMTGESENETSNRGESHENQETMGKLNRP